MDDEYGDISEEGRNNNKKKNKILRLRKDADEFFGKISFALLPMSQGHTKS